MRHILSQTYTYVLHFIHSSIHQSNTFSILKTENKGKTTYECFASAFTGRDTAKYFYFFFFFQLMRRFCFSQPHCSTYSSHIHKLFICRLFVCVCARRFVFYFLGMLCLSHIGLCVHCMNEVTINIARVHCARFKANDYKFCAVSKG